MSGQVGCKPREIVAIIHQGGNVGILRFSAIDQIHEQVGFLDQAAAVMGQRFRDTSQIMFCMSAKARWQRQIPAQQGSGQISLVSAEQFIGTIPGQDHP